MRYGIDFGVPAALPMTIEARPSDSVSLRVETTVRTDP